MLVQFNVVDEKTARQLKVSIDHNIADVQMWLWKLGLSFEERRQFWLDLAAQESEQYNYLRNIKPKEPIQVTIEPPKKMGPVSVPGSINWTRAHLVSDSLPWDFPVTEKQIANLAAHGYVVSIQPTGTGLIIHSSNGHTPTMEEFRTEVRTLLHLEPIGVGVADTAEKETTDGRIDIRQENGSVGRVEEAACPT